MGLKHMSDALQSIILLQRPSEGARAEEESTREVTVPQMQVMHAILLFDRWSLTNRDYLLRDQTTNRVLFNPPVVYSLQPLLRESFALGAHTPTFISVVTAVLVRLW